MPSATHHRLAHGLAKALVVTVAGAALLGIGQVASCASEAQDPPALKNTAAEAPVVVADEPDLVEEADVDECDLGRPEPPALAISSNTTQLLLVTSDTWKSFEGRLQRYERRCSRTPWTPVGVPVDVMLGRHGMGWGRGLHPDGEPGPLKVEHDQRSPAGVFDLGEARGYAKAPPDGTTWPFQHSGSAWRCMDNKASDAYNTFIPTSGALTPTPAGMAPREVVFELMVFVLHNTDPVQRGAGSCVFLHVWSKQGMPTQGCVAMQRESIREIVPWLSWEQRPVLAQLPVDVLARVGAAWGLPVAVR